MADLNQEEMMNQFLEFLKKFGSADKGLESVVKHMKKGEEGFSQLSKYLADANKSLKLGFMTSKQALDTIKGVDKQLKLLEKEIEEHERTLANSTDSEKDRMTAAELAARKNDLLRQKDALASAAVGKRFREV